MNYATLENAGWIGIGISLTGLLLTFPFIVGFLFGKRGTQAALLMICAGAAAVAATHW